MAKNGDRKRALDQRYYEENADELNAAHRARYAEKKPEIRVRQANWRAENPDRITGYNRRKRERHGDDLRARRRRHYRDNTSAYKAASVARRDHIRMATPPWADLKKIEAIYAEAERLTRETGIEHHVDHFYPLRGKTMCGLHVEGNLRIIPKLDNLRKSNSVPDEIPVPRESALRVSCRNREGLETVLSPAGP